MSEINVQVKDGPSAQMPAPVTVAEALKRLDRDLAKQALAARVNGREVDLAYSIEQENGEAVKIEPVLPQTLEGLDVLRHSTAHLLASALIDFCLGPHVPNTNRLRAFKLLSLAGAYWKGDAERPQMQRIYGTAFFTQEELDAWLKQREEAEKRDHRRLGRELDLFSIQEQYGQGLVLWHPKGAVVRQQMEDYLREELVRRNYSFVYT